jgi:cyanophycinase
MILALLLLAAQAGAPTHTRFVAGNAADVPATTRPLLVLQGGGHDVDVNYRAMGSAAGGGDFVVLRASGTDSYNAYIHALCGCDSVETIVFHTRAAAEDPEVLRTIRNAEAIWIAGGDQLNYVRMWKGTPMAAALEAHARRAPLGGTSAGMAVLGEIVYSAASGQSLTSAVALADPFHADVTLERDFLHLPHMDGVLTDQHWQERDRLGRTLAMLARVVKDGLLPRRRARAIAADRETALHVFADGTAEVFATATHATPYVYFLTPSRAPEVCAAGRPLTFTGVRVVRMGPGDGRFDLRRWKPVAGARALRYELSAREGRVTSSRTALY